MNSSFQCFFMLQSISFNIFPSTSLLCEQGHPLCVICPFYKRSMENNQIYCCLLLSTCFRQLNRNLCLENYLMVRNDLGLALHFSLLTSSHFLSFFFYYSFYEITKQTTAKFKNDTKTFAPSFC